MKKEKINKGMKKEHEITLIVSAALAIAILALFLVNFNFPISPAMNYESSNTVVVFRWLGFANRIFIDDNPDFVSAKVIDSVPGKGYTFTKLEPGRYYWKTNGISPIQTFAIESEVAIEIENSSVKNKGNVDALLDIFKKIGVTGQAIINVNQEMKVNESEDEKVVASQYENQ